MLPIPLPPYSIRNINFVGQNVRVIMTYSSGSANMAGIATGTANVVANIIFDYCGCSGTFFPEFAPIGWFKVGTSEVFSDHDWNNGGVTWRSGSIQYTNSRDDQPTITFPGHFPGGSGDLHWNVFRESTGSSHTISSPYTGLFEFYYHVTFSLDMVGTGGGPALIDFDWNATLYIGNNREDENAYNAGTIGGTFYNPAANAQDVNVGGSWRSFIPNFAMLAGQKKLIWIEWQVTNRGTSLDGDTGIGHLLQAFSQIICYEATPEFALHTYLVRTFHQ